ARRPRLPGARPRHHGRQGRRRRPHRRRAPSRVVAHADRRELRGEHQQARRRGAPSARPGEGQQAHARPGDHGRRARPRPRRGPHRRLRNERVLMQAPETAVEMLQVAADAAVSKGGEDLVALNVSEPLPLVDIFLLVTGNSERNVAAIADEVEDKLNEAGHKRVRREGRAEARWVLLDFGDLVVHVFHAEERTYYALERLWKDCPVVPIETAEKVAG